MTLGMKEHPLRRAVSAEVHARPFMHLQPSERATHLAMLSGEEGRTADRAHVARLCQHYGAPPPADGADFHLVDLGPFRLRWERHTEFSSYSFLAREAAPLRDDGRIGRFEHPVIERVPRDWLAQLPGSLLVGVHLELEAADLPEVALEELPQLLGIENFAGTAVSGGAATAYFNFSINEDGFGRILVRDHSLRPRQAGRLVQRLFEIETYRTMALLAFPTARRHVGDLSRLGDELTAVTQALSEAAGAVDEQALLDRLTAVSAEIEKLSAETSYRFGAARAYNALVLKRVAELREGRIEGLQTIGEFMDRRLTPAMRTCEAVAERLDSLANRVARTSQLLRTRVDIHLEAQNRDLLRSMDRRARLQLMLQETVEGLSVAAITYYGVGLVHYLAEGLEAGGLHLPTSLVTGIAVPVVAGLCWIGLRRVRRQLAERAGSPADRHGE
ncbi:Uncharacterized membrane-anchored protein [Tistlia consotensis]|uniref:Uncharacterized membrane-anchored protein n=1 Tax=Tistlia consotensis USBA 355 TaxID=560819 RepID=A0A1Y6B7W0_9PROT|nr:DUF3422 domain-containing protein [Tistlia consotensis]SME94724.1 Uncharacterized membrane-anchored protein [Tistlia consotensis USBA 355]SNR29519.1 Uncharacterized membrane-anchored protein [Tistlia consotensis]